MNKKKLMFVFGTRPEAIKMAPLIAEAAKYPRELKPIIVVTGQHRQMLDQVLRLFNIKPDHDLAIMEKDQSIARVVSKTLEGMEAILYDDKPDMLLVQGDTSTAFAAGLIAHYHMIPLGHVEAGLRTFDKWRPFPEEINRKLVTAIADLHFAPTETSVKNLRAEHVARETIYLTGNSVIDALLEVARRKFNLGKAGIKLDTKKKIVLVTTHRRESFGAPLQRTCRALLRLAREFQNEIELVVPVHSNPNVKDVVVQSLTGVSNIKLIEPLEYEPFVHLMKRSYIILTDSGGVQEEAPSLGKPVLVLREKTERPEAVSAGTVKLVGTDDKLIFKEARRLLTDNKAYARMSRAMNPYGDGKAAPRIIKSILYYFGLTKKKPTEFKVRRQKHA
jgi:UDP-N-acetylglucosamine 2-epimerase (non-hydrolysing)